MRDGRAFLQIDAAHLAAARPGLMGDEHPAEHRTRRRDRLVAPGADLHAAGLAAPAGMNLRLDHPDRAAELVDRGLDTLRLQHRNAARDRHSEPRQHLLGLIFVEVHGAVPPREDRGRALIALPRPPRLSQRRAAGRDHGGNPGQRSPSLHRPHHCSGYLRCRHQNGGRPRHGAGDWAEDQEADPRLARLACSSRTCPMGGECLDLSPQRHSHRVLTSPHHDRYE